MTDEYGPKCTMAYTEDLLQKNILIEFSQDHLGDAEIETVIFAISCTEKVSYLYTLFDSLNDIGPLELYRKIADAIFFIQSCSARTALKDLEEIAIEVKISSNVESHDIDKMVFEDNYRKFTTALQLIEEARRNHK